MNNSLKTSGFVAKYVEQAAKQGITLTPDQVKLHLNLFKDTLQVSLRDYPSVNVQPIGIFSLSRLAPRKRVLRDTVYHAGPSYRIRYYIDDEFQRQLREEYEPIHQMAQED